MKNGFVFGLVALFLLGIMSIGVASARDVGTVPTPDGCIVLDNGMASGQFDFSKPCGKFLGNPNLPSNYYMEHGWGHGGFFHWVK